MKTYIVNGISIWEYESDTEPNGQKIIEDHIKNSGTFIQIHGFKNQFTLSQILLVISEIRITPLFIHLYIYPTAKLELDAFVIYISEKLTKKQHKIIQSFLCEKLHLDVDRVK